MKPEKMKPEQTKPQKTKSLTINPAFKDLIPPLSNDEFIGLEQNILSHGQCRDAIKVWRGSIVDGHNRYAICQKHNIPYNTQKMQFSSKKDAELWIIQNQLGRRNLTNVMRIKLVLHKEALLREKAIKNRSGSQGMPVHVRKIMAKEAGVSEQTLYKFMKIRELGTPELIHRVESGQAKIGTAHRELEVITRTVETFHGCDGDYTPDIDNPHCAMAVLRNIEKVGKLLRFTAQNIMLMDGDDGANLIQKWTKIYYKKLCNIARYEPHA